MNTPTDDEIRAAFLAACDVVEHLAGNVLTIARELRVLAECERTHMLAPLKHSLSPMMETIGDLLNGMDAVDEENEVAIGDKFELVHDVLARIPQPGLKPSDN